MLSIPEPKRPILLPNYMTQIWECQLFIRMTLSTMYIFLLEKVGVMQKEISMAPRVILDFPETVCISILQVLRIGNTRTLNLEGNEIKMASLYNENINGFVFLVGEINGRKCSNPNAFCKELKDTFNWPTEVHCIDALYQMDWCEEDNYKVIVNKFHTITESKQKELIQESFNSYIEHWEQIRKKYNNQNSNHFIVEYR